MKAIDPVITAGIISGRCPRCGGRYLGQLDPDIDDTILKCISCQHKGTYFFHWPDELPKVTLRHRSNRQIVGGRKKKKTKRKVKSDVLPGQLSFQQLEYYK